VWVNQPKNVGQWEKMQDNARLGNMCFFLVNKTWEVWVPLNFKALSVAQQTAWQRNLTRQCSDPQAKQLTSERNLKNVA
jgi:hypothetical protein